MLRSAMLSRIAFTSKTTPYRQLRQVTLLGKRTRSARGRSRPSYQDVGLVVRLARQPLGGDATHHRYAVARCAEGELALDRPNRDWLTSRCSP